MQRALIPWHVGSWCNMQVALKVWLYFDSTGFLESGLSNLEEYFFIDQDYAHMEFLSVLNPLWASSLITKVLHIWKKLCKLWDARIWLFKAWYWYSYLGFGIKWYPYWSNWIPGLIQFFLFLYMKMRLRIMFWQLQVFLTMETKWDKITFTITLINSQDYKYVNVWWVDL